MVGLFGSGHRRCFSGVVEARSEKVAMEGTLRAVLAFWSDLVHRAIGLGPADHNVWLLLPSVSQLTSLSPLSSPLIQH